MVARRARPRGLHAAAHGFGRAVPLPLRRAQQCLGIGAEEEAQLLPGWRFKRDRLDVKVFAGLDIKNDATSPYDPSNRLHGTSVGARAAVNLWFDPTPSTMVAADASLSSIATGYSARAAYGWKLHEWFYLGPEAQTFACVGYSQL